MKIDLPFVDLEHQRPIEKHLHTLELTEKHLKWNFSAFCKVFSEGTGVWSEKNVYFETVVKREIVVGYDLSTSVSNDADIPDYYRIVIMYTTGDDTRFYFKSKTKAEEVCVHLYQYIFNNLYA